MEGKEPFAASDNGPACGCPGTSLTWGRWGQHRWAHREMGGVVAMEHWGQKGWDVENRGQGRNRAQGSVDQSGAVLANLGWVSSCPQLIYGLGADL